MTAKRFAVVVNPRGGTQRGRSVLDLVEPVFRSAGAELEIHVTQHCGHATEIAQRLDLSSCDGLCVIGGDGTVHEVVNGLMQQDGPVRVPLGIIPAGTGNTLHQHVELEHPIEAARTICAGVTQPLDVARVTLADRVIYCVNIIGWGAVADINATAEKLRFLGAVRYSLAALWHIVRFQRHRIQLVRLGETIDDKFLFVIACNTRFTGAGMKLAPHAEIGDGKLDLIALRHASRWQLLRLFQKVFDGSHLSMGILEYHQVDSFAIQSGGHERLNLDGEMIGNAPCSVDMLPSALRIFAR
jgi:YegS/Rv2252/BmrU family lipid kinase